MTSSKAGFEVVGGEPTELGNFMQNEHARLSKFVKEAGIKLEYASRSLILVRSVDRWGKSDFDAGTQRDARGPCLVTSCHRL
jgi:uncharacterized protein (DUF1499 family)